MSFRKDINGLRAIAVIAVVLYHFNYSWLTGGFAGVDVFFVISGFLMTGIIFRGIEQENFSVLKFYVARANRIVPALAVLCMTLLVFGWFYLIPMDYKELGKHVGSSIGFLSNVIYWKESGYFDAASQEKWLLHTWSLSVEWQFYIIYPLALVALRKLMSIKLLKFTILFGAIIGFVFCIIVTYKWPTPSYYLLSSRAWEMMVGGVAYLYPFKLGDIKNKIIEKLGLILIFGSYLLLSKDNLWPGYLAVFPVLGAFFIIQAKRNDSFITNNIIFQKIGAWSYSIYLWHWPLVVAIYYFSLSEIFIYIGITLSILLGFISNRYIEKIKFKNDFHYFLEYLKCKPVFMVLLVGLFGSYVFLGEGKNFIEYIYPKNATTAHLLEAKIVMPHRGIGYCFYSFTDNKQLKVDAKIGTNCILGDKNKQPQTLLFGDSFAGTYDPLFDAIFKNNHLSYNSVSTNWCAPSFTDNFTGPKDNIAYKQCQFNVKYLYDVIKNKKYKNIILSGSWSDVVLQGFLKDTEKVIYEAQKNGINVFIMPTPLAYKQNPLSKFYRQVYRGEETNIVSYISKYEHNNKFNDILFDISEKYQKVYFIKRNSLFNGNGLFDYKGINVPYSLDGDHISLLGSLFTVKTFEESPYYGLLMN